MGRSEGRKALKAWKPSKAELRDMEAAHTEGLHEDLPREFCPLCKGRR